MKSPQREVAIRSKAEIQKWRELSSVREANWPWWARILIWVPCFVGVVLIGSTLPFSGVHFKVIGGVFLWSVHAWMLLDSLVSGVFESKQGNYDRAKSPFCFWAMCLLMAFFQITMAVAGIAAWYEI